MLYLTGCIPAKPEIQADLLAHGIGALLTPYSQRVTPNDDWVWAADNGCFGKTWKEQTWLTWLESKQSKPKPLFATVPDVVADHNGTMERWHQYAPIVRQLGYQTAFVLQDGSTPQTIPIDEFDALFIGGTTEFKLSRQARNIVDYCKEHGKWIHMGRVNSKRRIEIAHEWGCDSVDGTYLAFSPDANTPRLIQMMNIGTQPKLFDHPTMPPSTPHHTTPHHTTNINTQTTNTTPRSCQSPNHASPAEHQPSTDHAAPTAPPNNKHNATNAEPTTKATTKPKPNRYEPTQPSATYADKAHDTETPGKPTTSTQATPTPFSYQPIAAATLPKATNNPPPRNLGGYI